MRRKAAALGCFLAHAILAGCSLLDTNGLAGAESLAASDSGGESGPESGGEGAASETASPGSDAGLTDAVADGTWCERNAPSASFCDDFEGPALGARWTEVNEYMATLALVESGEAAHRRVFRIAISRPPEVAVANLQKRIEIPVKAVDYAFDVRLNALAQTMFGPGTITLDGTPPRGYATVGLYLEGQTLVANPQIYDANGQITSGGLSQAISVLPMRTWTRVRIVLVLSDSPPTIQITVDNKIVLGRTIPGFVPAPATIGAGTGFTAPTADGWLYDLDNVTIDFR